MAFDNHFLENSSRHHNSRVKNLKPLIQILQELAVHAIIGINRKKQIKSKTREFIEPWMTYSSSRSWRLNQPRTSLHFRIASRDQRIPISIRVGNIQKKKSLES